MIHGVPIVMRNMSLVSIKIVKISVPFSQCDEFISCTTNFEGLEFQIPNLTTRGLKATPPPALIDSSSEKIVEEKVSYTYANEKRKRTLCEKKIVTRLTLL